jgi:hypothetical protein
MALPKTNHAGNALSPELDLFAPAPGELGEILSAASTLRKDDPGPPTNGRRLRNLIIWAVIGYASIRGLGFLVPHAIGPLYGLVYRLLPIPYAGMVVVQGIPTVGLAAAGWFLTAARHQCSFVGKNGVALFGFKDQREATTRTGFFLFNDATELRTGQTRNFRNGVYTGTTYTFRWTNAEGKQVFNLGGMYHMKDGNPPDTHAFHVARAAELAWSMHLFDRTVRELERAGVVKFSVSGRDWIGVGPGFLELCFGGKPPARCDRADLSLVSVKNGYFTMKRKDAKVGWFSSEGVFTFPYANMANARVFLFALDKLGGIQVS